MHKYLFTKRSSKFLGSPCPLCRAIVFLSSLSAALFFNCCRSNSPSPSVASTVYLCPVLAFNFGIKPRMNLIFIKILDKIYFFAFISPSYPGVIGCLYKGSVLLYLAFTVSMSVFGGLCTYNCIDNR